MTMNTGPVVYLPAAPTRQVALSTQRGLASCGGACFTAPRPGQGPRLAACGFLGQEEGRRGPAPLGAPAPTVLYMGPNPDGNRGWGTAPTASLASRLLGRNAIRRPLGTVGSTAPASRGNPPLGPPSPPELAAQPYYCYRYRYRRRYA